MNTERLEIRKFGPIEDINVELKPIMVFIGCQASGKSTISKLIALFRGWDFIFNEKEFKTLLNHYNISSYLNEESYIKFSSEAHVFEWSNGIATFTKKDGHPYHIAKQEYDEHNKIIPEASEINIPATEKELDDIKIELTSSDLTEDGKNKLIIKQNELSARLNGAMLYQVKFGAYAKEVFKVENYSEYIPSERNFVGIASGLFLNLSTNKVPLPGTLLSFGAEFEKARIELKTLDIDFLGAKYKYENNEDRIYVGTNKHIPFKESASGFQTLIPMLLVIDYKTTDKQFNGLTFIVEEPELNLFPTAQQHLTRRLIKKCTLSNSKKSFNNELVITTHSPYILSSLNNLLFAHIIATKKPESVSKIENFIPKESWIDSNNFSAYSLEKGKIYSIVDKDTSLISESELDSASEEINNEFDILMDIYSN